MSKEIKNTSESNECCDKSSCCGVDKANVAKFLRHVAEFFDTKQN